MALEMLKEAAEEHGIDLDAIDTEEARQEEERQREEAESHDLAKWSMEYAEIVDTWFKGEECLFKEKGHQLIREHELNLPDTNPEAEAASLQESVEVIRWYQYQIHVKMMRALMGLERDLDLDEEFPSDADGSAKVSLIGMDRSISAWTRLREHFPEKEDEILDVLVLLGRLRSRAEQQFPEARAFVRPGFDTG
jgi:hypothetical protein